MAENLQNEQARALKLGEMKGFIENLSATVGAEYERYESEAKWRRRYDVWLRAASAILAVAAPALVTFQPSQESALFFSDEAFRILVILLVAFAGASITLQAVFAFDKKYANSKMTAAKLQQLSDSIKYDLLSADLISGEERYHLLRNTIKNAADIKSSVIMKYVEDDINNILSTEDRIKTVKDKHASESSPLLSKTAEMIRN